MKWSNMRSAYFEITERLIFRVNIYLAVTIQITSCSDSSYAIRKPLSIKIDILSEQIISAN